MNQVTMNQVENANTQWFAPGNKKFFGDRSYAVVMSANGKPYLLRATYQWSDMFGRKKTLVYRINPIDSDSLKIKTLVDVTFNTRNEAKNFISHDYPELLEKQRELMLRYEKTSGISLRQAFNEGYKVCGQIPVLESDYWKNVYPQYEKTLDELLSYKTTEL